MRPVASRATGPSKASRPDCPLPAGPNPSVGPRFSGVADGDAVRCVACAHRCLIGPGGRASARSARTATASSSTRLRAGGRRQRRPDREEAALPLPPRQRRVLHRHAGLQLPLPALPELGHLAGRTRRPVGAELRSAAGRGRGGSPGRGLAQHRLHLHRAHRLHRVRPRHGAPGRSRQAWPTSWSRTATRRPRRWTCWRRTSRPPTSTSSRSTIASTAASSAPGWRRSWTRWSGMRARGIWIEVTTLLIPGLNDDPDGAGDAGRAGSRRTRARDALARQPLLPHLPADGPRSDAGSDYPSGRSRSAAPRGCATSTRATSPSGDEDTRCAGCGETLIRRRGFVRPAGGGSRAVAARAAATLWRASVWPSGAWSRHRERGPRAGAAPAGV